MKKILILLITLGCLSFITGCNSGKVETSKISQNAENQEVEIEQQETDFEGKELIIVSGILEKTTFDGHQYVIYEKYESRSKTGYFINIDNSNLETYNALSGYIGSIVSVNAYIVEEISPWTKVITIEDFSL